MTNKTLGSDDNIMKTVNGNLECPYEFGESMDETDKKKISEISRAEKLIHRSNKTTLTVNRVYILNGT